MVKDKDRRGEITPTKEAYKLSLNLALPAIAEMISVSIMGMINTAMVGKLGSYAVAAVGLTNQPRMLFMSVFFAMNVGVTAIVSRRKGQDNQESAKACVRQSLMIGTVLALIITVLAVISSQGLMLLAGAQEDTLAPATEYFRIIGMGFAFQALSMTICAAQRGIGNTQITMICNLTANVTNIVLCFVLIDGNLGFPQLGVNGAAIATFASYFVSFVLAFFSLFKKGSYLCISIKDDWKPDMPMIESITRIGLGSMLEQVALRIGFFIYARVVADLGTDNFAAHQIAMQLMNLSFTFGDGIAVATTSLVGQNLGSNRPDLSIMYGKVGQRIAFIIAMCLSVTSIVGRYFFSSLFSDDLTIINLTADVIIILAFILPVQTSHIVMSGSLRGAGDIQYVAMTMLITVAILRPLVSYALIYPLGLGLRGAWYASAFDQTIRLILVFTRFSKGKWIHITV